MKLKFTNKMKGANKFNNKAGIVSSISSSNNVNRQCLSADGFSLLPSALRPCLFCLALVLASGFVILGINTNNTFASTYSISMNVPSSINMGASAAGNGAKVTESDITVISTCPSGYTVNIVGPSDTTLYKDGDSGNSESNNSTNYIEASTGTKNNPASITGSNLNTWGYTLTHGNNINNDTFIGLTNSTTELTSASSATSSSGVVIPVYYGVSVDTNRTAGTYQMANSGAITYTLTTDISCTSYQVAFNSNGGTGTMDSQWIAEDTATALATNTFVAPSGLYFGGWNTAADGSGTDYANGEVVTDLAAVGQTITLYAQWTDCPAGNICYNDNGANSTTKMSNQSIGTDATSADLWASNFQRSGYGFLGWSTKANPVIGTDTIYGPMETISNINVSQGGIKLYAVWKAAAKDGSNNPIYLQDWNGCSGLTATTYNSTTGKLTVAPNSVIALTDKRDSQVYAVAKLADDNCWMIENLRLEAAGTVGNNAIDPSVTNQSLAQGYGGTPGTYGSFVGLANAETANFADDASAANSIYKSDGTNTIYNPSTNPVTLEDIGAGGNPGYRMPRYRNDNTTLAEGETDTANSNDVDTYAYGNYYTWAAAIANTTRYTSYSASDAAGTSLCPAGWQLPLGYQSKGTIESGSSDTANRVKGFSYLDRKMGGTGANQTSVAGIARSKVWRSFPNNFLYSGCAYNSGISNRGLKGDYWSSSAFTSDYAYRLHLERLYFYPGTNYSSKFDGFTVRCVAGS